MDTKWKKWKKAGSVAVFLLGLYLTMMAMLTSGLYAVNQIVFGNGIGALKEQLEPDYENTDEFRWYVGNKLEELLGMAVGGWSWQQNGVEYSTSYGVAYDTVTIVQEGSEGIDRYFNWLWGETPVLMTESAAAMEVPAEVPAELEEGFSLNDAGLEEETEKHTLTKEERIQAHHEDMAKDTNLLYRIYYDGVLKYTNAEGMDLDGMTGKLPEGYNFLLYFDGEKTHIYKDGKKLEIYGDGFYDPEISQWYVPGYQNFNVDEDTKKAQIVMAVAENPRLYVQGDYSRYGISSYGGRLYYMKNNQDQRRSEFLRNMGFLFLGIVLLVLSIVFWKQKKTADQWLAKQTGKCPLEIKLLFCLGLVYWMLRRLHWGGYGNWRVILFFIVILLYLLINDLIINWGHQNSLIKKLWLFFRTKELELPVQKRIIRRQRSAFIVSAACLILLLLILLFDQAAYSYFWWIDTSVIYFLLCTDAVLLLVSVVLVVRCLLYDWKLADDIGKLDYQVSQVHDGNLTDSLELPKDHDLRQMAEQINDIQQGMHEALEEQMKSERMKVELISNVSHDIKTPLTSIISYVELLKQEEDLPDHVKDYVQILDQKSERLKTMVQDVFEVSKAASGQLPVKFETLDMQRLLCQTLADMDERIQESGMRIKTDFLEGELFVKADGQRLYRVFQNLLQNALQYSLPGSRIYVSLRKEEEHALARIQNTSLKELDANMDFTERFVRGDDSRTDGGSGLGLSIARSFTEACGGSFQIQVDADLFTVEVNLPLAESK